MNDLNPAHNIIIINPILVWVYPRKQGWLDLPHSKSNLSNAHSPSRSIQGILLLQTNTHRILKFGLSCRKITDPGSGKLGMLNEDDDDCRKVTNLGFVLRSVCFLLQNNWDLGICIKQPGK